mmetsp:Transcript_49662/g.153406  ORF Transcript_49662/g.153406 Transcript_49662/m.153406 type:complete len:351 (+) Transcript_49662:808-1860(+)
MDTLSTRPVRWYASRNVSPPTFSRRHFISCFTSMSDVAWRRSFSSSNACSVMPSRMLPALPLHRRFTSSSVRVQKMEAMMAPADDPHMMRGSKPSFHKARTVPLWYMPRAAPPLRRSAERPKDCSAVSNVSILASSDMRSARNGRPSSSLLPSSEAAPSCSASTAARSAISTRRRSCGPQSSLMLRRARVARSARAIGRGVGSGIGRWGTGSAVALSSGGAAVDSSLEASGGNAAGNRPCMPEALMVLAAPCSGGGETPGALAGIPGVTWSDASPIALRMASPPALRAAPDDGTVPSDCMSTSGCGTCGLASIDPAGRGDACASGRTSANSSMSCVTAEMYSLTKTFVPR